MPIYIVRPKQRHGAVLATLEARSLAPEHRSRQIDETREIRRSGGGFDDIQSWVRDHQPTGRRGFAESLSPAPDLLSGPATPVTGSLIIRMNEEQAETARKDLPDVAILLDQPLNLIRPIASELSHRASLNDADTWHLDLTGVRAARATNVIGTGKNVPIAILDTGIQDDHPEINGRVIAAYEFDVPTATTHRQPVSRDTQGHGTHVAGLIAGRTCGIAPEALLINGLMLPKGKGMISNFILAMEAMVGGIETPAQIINMSAGLPGFLPEMEEAIAGLLSAGALPVFAIGNEGADHTRSPGNFIDALSVGACNQLRKVSTFSGGGTITHNSHIYTVPDLVAPGEGVFSCVMDGGYEAWDGTSMATPIVSGIAALVIERYPQISLPELIAAILAKCEDLGEPVVRQGKGLVSYKSAV